MRQAGPVGMAMVTCARAQSGTGPGPARTARPGRVRPRAVWRDLTPAGQARIRQTFVRVLLEVFGAAAGPREVGRDAPRR
jgi:hypothetical protein